MDVVLHMENTTLLGRIGQSRLPAHCSGHVSFLFKVIMNGRQQLIAMQKT